MGKNRLAWHRVDKFNNGNSVTFVLSHEHPTLTFRKRRKPLICGMSVFKLGNGFYILIGISRLVKRDLFRFCCALCLYPSTSGTHPPVTHRNNNTKERRRILETDMALRCFKQKIKVWGLWKEIFRPDGMSVVEFANSEFIT